jgi:hypothetical protein
MCYTPQYVAEASVDSCILVRFIFHNCPSGGGRLLRLLPIHTEGSRAASVVDSEVVALVLPAIDDPDCIDASSGKSLNFCLQEGQGASPPIIFLAK